ncbi:MAG: hypothetical protein IJE23_01860 [Tyzzerella sp.]|nr:hypothetical protein [Tyzzerella sp.]
MKKYVIIAITFVFLIVLAMAIGLKLTPNLKVTLGKDQKVNTNDTVSVTLDLNSKEDVYGIQFDLLFDEEVLEYQSSNTKLSNKWYSRCEYIQKGTVRVILYDASDFTTPIKKGDLYELLFDTKDYRGDISTVLRIDNFKAYDKNGNNIQDVKSKSVKIKLK